MSHQRRFIRQIVMELSSSGLQPADHPTAAEVREELAILPQSSLLTFSNVDNSSGSTNNNNNQWELQHLRGEQQDPLLARSTPMMNKRFSLLDVWRETVHLARGRSTFISVLLATFTLVLLLEHVCINYISYTTRYGEHTEAWLESKRSCEENILDPWRNAALQRNMSATRQDEFYMLFKQNCTSVFRDPPEEVGFFKFINGTFTFTTSSGFALTKNTLIQPHVGGYLLVQTFAWIWSNWGQAAVAWGLLVATQTAMGHYSRPSHRDLIQMPSQKLTNAFREQFSYKVFLGTIRVCLTELPISTLCFVVDCLIAMVRSVVVSKSVDLRAIEGVDANLFWSLANPLPYIFLLSTVAAALEPGMWGFKALWRGIQLARGNRSKSYCIFLVLFLLAWLRHYLYTLIDLKPDQILSESLWGMLRRSIMTWSVTAITGLPRFFLLPVFYFLCKSWREKVATMA